METPSAPAILALRAARSFLSGAADLLYPERCVHCGRFGELLCEACLAVLDDVPPGPRCRFCFARWDGGDNCPRCARWDALDRAIAAADYEGVARDIVRALKYQRTRALAGVIAARIRPLLDAEPADLVFPIPLHRSRLRERGFNQAELVARDLGLVIPAGLTRRRKTRQQFGLSHAERAHNVAGAFGYRGLRLDGRRVVLLDDVVTTGATANECARVLRDAGAASVRVVAFARASYRPAAIVDPIDL